MATSKAKTVRASQKKPSIPVEQLQQTHAAQPAAVDMYKLFGLKKTYDVDTPEEYSKQLESMGRTELWNHSHKVGVIPMEPLDKLITALKRKFVESKRNSIQPQVVPTRINPEFADFHKKFMRGEL